VARSEALRRAWPSVEPRSSPHRESTRDTPIGFDRGNGIPENGNNRSTLVRAASFRGSETGPRSPFAPPNGIGTRGHSEGLARNRGLALGTDATILIVFTRPSWDIHSFHRESTAAQMFTPQDQRDDDAACEALLARALGLEEIRIGRHKVRDKEGLCSGAILVRSLWILRVVPSFHPPGLLCVASAEGDSWYSRKAPGWIKGVLATGDEIVCVSLKTDPLPTILNGLPLLLDSNGFCLDGIGYRLNVRSSALDSALRFSNPQSPEFVTLEAKCWELGNQWAGNSGNPTLKGFISSWKGYCHTR
jgi:hypothetical protein